MMKKLFVKIWHIIKGTYFNIFNKEEKFYRIRIAVCDQCDKKYTSELGKRWDACEICGCLLYSKTRVKEEACPYHKW